MTTDTPVTVHFTVNQAKQLLKIADPAVRATKNDPAHRAIVRIKQAIDKAAGIAVAGRRR